MRESCAGGGGGERKCQNGRCYGSRIGRVAARVIAEKTVKIAPRPPTEHGAAKAWWILKNFLGLLRVRARVVRDPHRAPERKISVDIFMRVSAPARNGRQRKRRPVQHKNKRRTRFGVRLVGHPIKVQRRWGAVAC